MRTVSLLLLGLLTPSVAFAAAPADEIDELVRSIDREAQALTTDDCTSACKALASMRRATERLCKLDPEARCAEARAKLVTATEKVRSACPVCAVDATPKLAPEDREMPTTAAAASPPPERARGGCAGCSTTGATSDAVPWLAIAALATLLRRRREKPRA